MVKMIVGLAIFIAGMWYGIRSTMQIMSVGPSAVAYLDLSFIRPGMALPLPGIISLVLAVTGSLLMYRGKKEKNKTE